MGDRLRGHSVSVWNDRSLAARLSAAGVPQDATPLDAWRRLREVEGPYATVIDLYGLVGRRRGLPPNELPLPERVALARSVMGDAWPGFMQVEGSERSGDAIRIVEYDPEWPLVYQQWRAVVTASLGDTARRIEHVGSTSVPGLPAKPIIDIQVSVDDLFDESGYLLQLEGAGLQLRSRDDWHRYFRPFPGRPRVVHVHVCPTGSQWERAHLLFRDYLRTHPEACDAYAAAKRKAASLWADDGVAYTDAKTEVILTLLDAAERWSSPHTSS